MLPMILAAIDQTIVAAALPDIATALDGAEVISWVIVGWLLAAIVVTPVFGRLGDVFGRRRLMFVGLTILTVASVVSALSITIEMLIFARILQGAGAGGLIGLAQALLAEAVPPRERARYQGYLAAVMIGSNAVGPVIGGLLAQHLGWPAIFLFNVPLALAAIALTWRLPPKGGTGEPFRFDMLGLILFALLIGSGLMMLELTRRFEAELMPISAALLAVSVAVVVLLLRQEKRARDPLLPLPMFRIPSVWRADALAACHGAVMVSLITLLPIYLRAVQGLSAGDIGLLMLPLTVSAGVGAVTTGLLVGRTGRTAVFPTVGMICLGASLAAIAMFLPRLPLEGLFVLIALGGLFMGTVMAVVQVTVQVAAGPAMLGSAAASVELSRSIGAAFGTAGAGGVLFAVMTLGAPETVGVFAAALETGPVALRALPEAQATVVEAQIANAFRVAFGTVAGFALLGALAARSIPLRRI